MSSGKNFNVCQQAPRDSESQLFSVFWRRADQERESNSRKACRTFGACSAVRVRVGL